MKNKRIKYNDILRNSSTIFATCLSVITLLAIILYVFINGVCNLSWDFIISDYKEELNTVCISQNNDEFTDPKIDNSYFSKQYGISLKDSKTVDGKPCIEVVYIASNSLFNKLIIISNGEKYQISKGEKLDVLIGETTDLEDVYSSSKDGAQLFANSLDKSNKISYLQCSKSGGGIKGSIITILYLIIITLLISLPLGICASIYLMLYAREGKIRTIITNMIDATSGIPSIIFGLVGAIVFIPFVSSVSNKTSYSILAGALTMTIVLLPTIIKTTNEAINVVPKDYMLSSLALGASKTQTIFKLIIPNIIPGILTACLLSIGRIIGESAALIFVMGTSIEDNINIFNGSTSLSLHIWSITRADVPNYNAACSISIIILLVVFILNIIVKIISYNINKKKGA